MENTIYTTQIMSENGRKKSRRRRMIRDPEYIAYIGRGDSKAILALRDHAKTVDMRDRWADIILRLDNENGTGCPFFVAEVFPKEDRPDYSKADSPDEIRWLTWKTATDDIKKQRDAGWTGLKFAVVCDLRQVTEMKTYKRYYDTVWDQWVDSEGPNTELRDYSKEVKYWKCDIISDAPISDEQYKKAVEQQDAIKEILSRHAPDQNTVTEIEKLLNG